MVILFNSRAEAVPPAEFNSLRQKVSIMENELSSNCTKLNMTENSRRALESKVAKYEDEIKKLKGSEVCAHIKISYQTVYVINTQ